jgi:hypothetical protein
MRKSMWLLDKYHRIEVVGKEIALKKDANEVSSFSL